MTKSLKTLKKLTTELSFHKKFLNKISLDMAKVLKENKYVEEVEAIHDKIKKDAKII